MSLGAMTSLPSSPASPSSRSVVSALAFAEPRAGQLKALEPRALEPKALERAATTPSDLLRPGVNPKPFQAYDTPLSQKCDWQLVVELLPERDPSCEYYTLRDIAPCLGPVTPSQLSDHAKSVFPDYEGWYKLNFTEAVRLVRRYVLAGRKKFARAQWEAMWLAKYPSLSHLATK